MFKYLIQHAWLVLRTDGLITLIQETLKYIGVYYPPHKVLKWWFTRLANIKMAVRDVQGSLMILDLRDKGIHRDLYLNGIREPQATKYLQSIMKPEWTVVDIGANIGYYALQEARAVSEVIAIEPASANYAALETNIDLNGYVNVEAHQLAVGDYEGEAEFELSRACNWNRIAIRNKKGTILVQVETLDRFLNGGKADFVRMDVEGYEMNVLKGMERILSNHAPRMFIEIHRDKLRGYGSSQREVMEYLSRFGYSIEKSFIMGRVSVTGRIDSLLAHPKTALEITERGIVSHIFLICDSKRWEE